MHQCLSTSTPSVSNLWSNSPLITCHLILSELNLSNWGDDWGPSGIPLHSMHQLSMWVMTSSSVCSLSPQRPSLTPSRVVHQRAACAIFMECSEGFSIFCFVLFLTRALLGNVLNNFTGLCRISCFFKGKRSVEPFVGRLVVQLY